MADWNRGEVNVYPRNSYGRGKGGSTRNQNDADLPQIDWDSKVLAPFKKNFYKESNKTKNLSTEDIRKFYEESKINLISDVNYNPCLNFEDATFPDKIQHFLNQSGFLKPTPIQSQSWPILLSGRDMVGVAKTGSGKTLSYLLPGIIHALSQPRSRSREGPIVLVVCPTRELAQQVYTVAEQYARVIGLSSLCVYGGVSKSSNKYALSRGIDILIATPGRLIDLVSIRATDLERCTYLVLDEADRMLDMGFEPQIRKIIGQIRPDRQTLMFSATWPKEIVNLANEFFVYPVRVNVGSLELSANHSITQIIDVVREDEKMNKLINILQKCAQQNLKAIVFVARKKKCDDLVYALKNAGIRSLAIHGDKSQADRDYVLKEFRNRSNVMIATDVAARGLDIPDVSYVINYDFPNTVEEYVHRIGRTGRASSKGTAYTFFTHENAGCTAGLIKVLREAKQVVPPTLEGMVNQRYNNKRGTGYRRYNGGNRVSNGEGYKPRNTGGGYRKNTYDPYTLRY